MSETAVAAPKASKTRIVNLDAGRLVPHPNNREFPVTGEEWEQFVESIRFRGVVLPVLVRPMGDDWQIIAGHRRTAAARACGMLTVPVIIQAMDDKQAMEMVFVDNLMAVDLNPVDEARGVAGLMEVGMTAEHISERICKDIRWVRTRQGILPLGDEVVAAMKLPKEDPKHLGVRVVEEILKAPEELRAEAIQLVMHPDFEAAVLNPRQAAEVIQEQLVKPWQARIEWEQGREKIAKKGWRPRLEKQCLRGTKKELVVMSVPWADTEKVTKGGVEAEKLVPVGEQTPEAPQFLRWFHLAVRHGMPVRVVHDPAGGQDKSLALVDGRVLIDAEEANAESLNRAERDLAAAEDEAVNASHEADRTDAQKRIPELKTLIESLRPWLVTKARGRVSREAVPAKAPVGGSVVGEPVSGEEPEEPVMTCEGCGEGCGERYRCMDCGKMHCMGCVVTVEEDWRCDACEGARLDVPAFLRKKPEEAAPVQDEEDPPWIAIRSRPLRMLRTAALSGEAGLACEVVPEWAKALEPQHVLDVLDWIQGLRGEEVAGDQ